MVDHSGYFIHIKWELKYSANLQNAASINKKMGSICDYRITLQPREIVIQIRLRKDARKFDILR